MLMMDGNVESFGIFRVNRSTVCILYSRGLKYPFLTNKHNLGEY